MLAQFMPGVEPKFHPPTSVMSVLVLISNLTVALVAILTAYLVRTNPAFFVRSSVSATTKRK